MTPNTTVFLLLAIVRVVAFELMKEEQTSVDLLGRVRLCCDVCCALVCVYNSSMGMCCALACHTTIGFTILGQDLTSFAGRQLSRSPFEPAADFFEDIPWPLIYSVMICIVSVCGLVHSQ